MIQAWRGALKKINLRLFLGQWLGNAVLMLLAAAWLQVPTRIAGSSCFLFLPAWFLSWSSSASTP